MYHRGSLFNRLELQLFIGSIILSVQGLRLVLHVQECPSDDALRIVMWTLL